MIFVLVVSSCDRRICLKTTLQDVSEKFILKLQCIVFLFFLESIFTTIAYTQVVGW